MDNLHGTHVLEAVIDELEYGPTRNSIDLHQSIHHQLCTSLEQTSGGGEMVNNITTQYNTTHNTCTGDPDTYFAFRSERNAPMGNDTTGIDIPLLPQLAGNNPYSKRGYAFGCWYRLPASCLPSSSPLSSTIASTVPTNNTTGNNNSSSTPSKINSNTTNVLPLRDMVLARFFSPGGGPDTEIFLRIGGEVRGTTNNHTLTSSSSSSTSSSTLTTISHTTYGISAVLGVRNLAGNTASIASSFRAPLKRAQLVETIVYLEIGKWYHIGVSQSQPGLSLTNPQCSIYWNGKKVMEQDNSCPPLPFLKGSIGTTNTIGDIAHPQLYAERLSLYHIQALVQRGINVPTLHHYLHTPLPNDTAPEILRAGLVTTTSLDTLLDGLPSSINNRSTTKTENLSHVPPLLLYINPLTALAHIVHPAEGIVEVNIYETLSHDTEYSNYTPYGYHPSSTHGVPNPSKISLPNSTNATSILQINRHIIDNRDEGISIKIRSCSLNWSKGLAMGEAASNNKKQFTGIVGCEIQVATPTALPTGTSNLLIGNGGTESGSTVSLRGTINADDMNGTFHLRAHFGSSVRIIIRPTVTHGNATAVSLLPSSTGAAASLPITVQSWHAVGGILRLLELIRIIPLRKHSDNTLMNNDTIDDSLVINFNKSDDSIFGIGTESKLDSKGTKSGTILSLSSSTSTPSVCSTTSIISNAIKSLMFLLQNDYNHREDMFQMRGFASLAQILRERYAAVCSLFGETLQLEHTTAVPGMTGDGEIKAPSSTNPGYSYSSYQMSKEAAKRTSIVAEHMLSLEIWRNIHKLLTIVRCGIKGWDPLYSRGTRFLLSDWKLWTDPLTGRTKPLEEKYTVDTPAPSGHTLETVVRTMIETVPIAPTLLLEYSQYVSSLATASPSEFLQYTSFDFQGICDVLANSMQSFSLSLLHSQLLVQQQLHPWLITETNFTHLYEVSEAAMYHRASLFASFLDETNGTTSLSIPTIRTYTQTTVERWTMALQAIVLYHLGGFVRHSNTISSSGTVPTGGNTPGPNFPLNSSVYDPAKVGSCIAILLFFISRMCQEHKRFQVQQEALAQLQNDLYIRHVQYLRKHRQEGISITVSPFAFATISGESWDPFSEACNAGLDLVCRLIKSFPQKVHIPYESAKGTMAVTACAEADAEPVRIGAINVLSAIIALRRTIPAKSYGEDNSARPATNATLNNAPSNDAGKAQPPPVPGQDNSSSSSSGTASANPQLTLQQQQQAAAHQAALTAREKQLRLLKVLWNTLLNRPNTTMASAISALQLVLAPDIPFEGKGTLLLSGLGINVSGTTNALTNESRERSGTGTVDDTGSSNILSSLTSATAITCPEGLPVVFLLLSEATTRMQRRKRIGSTMRTNPWVPPSEICRRTNSAPLEVVTFPSPDVEALQMEAEQAGRLRLVFDLSLLLKSRNGTNAMAWMRQPGWQSWLLDLMIMPQPSRGEIFSINEGNIWISTEGKSSINNNGPGNNNNSIGSQNGNSLSSLDDGRHSRSNSVTGYLHSQGKASGGKNKGSSTASTVAAVAMDMLVSLLYHAMELDSGSRVFISTMAIIADRYRKDTRFVAQLSVMKGLLLVDTKSIDNNSTVVTTPMDKAVSLDDNLLDETIGLGFAHIFTVLLERFAREKPRLIPDLRANIFRMFRFALSRLSGQAFTKVAVAALPVLVWIRTSSKPSVIHGMSGGIVTQQIVPPSAEPLRGQDLWLVLMILVRLLPTLSGFVSLSNAKYSVNEQETVPVIGTLLTPQTSLFSDCISILQGLLADEIASLYDPEVVARDAALASSTAIQQPSLRSKDSSNIAKGFSTIFSNTANEAVPSPGSSVATAGNRLSMTISTTNEGSNDVSSTPRPVVVTGSSRAGDGSRIDAIMYILSGLQASMNNINYALLALETVKNGLYTNSLIDVPLFEESYIGCQSMCTVLGLSMINNSSFGAWSHAIAHFRDEAYMRGKGRFVPVGGFRNPAMASMVTSPSLSLSTNTSLLSPVDFGGMITSPSVSSAGMGISSSTIKPSAEVDLLDVTFGAGSVKGNNASLADAFDPFADLMSTDTGSDKNKVNNLVNNNDPFGTFDPFTTATTAPANDTLITRSDTISRNITLTPREETNVPVSTNVPPPPVDRTRAIFDALGPAIREIEERMNPVIGSDMIRNQIRKVQKDTSSSVAPTNDNENEIDDKPSWLRDLLLAEYKASPTNPVTLTMDRTVLGTFRIQQCSTEALRLEKVLVDLLSRTRMVHAHWMAVRILLSRHARIALRARRRAQTALRRHDSTYLADFEGGAALIETGPGTDTKSVSTNLLLTEEMINHPDTLEAVQVDSHELRSRTRNRLVTVRGDPLLAPTYVEYGRMGKVDSSLVTSSASVLDNAKQKDVARVLARAGAIKDVSTTKDTGLPNTREEEEEEDTNVPTDTKDMDTVERDDDEEDGDDNTSDARSLAMSTRSGLTSGPNASFVGNNGGWNNALPGRPSSATETEVIIPDEIAEVEEQIHQGPSSSLGQYRGITANVLLVKQAGSAPGTLHLLPSNCLVWEPRSPIEKIRDDDPFGAPDPDSVIPPKRTRKIFLTDITAVFLRCYRLYDSALELFVAAYGGPRRRRYFFNFENTVKRDDMVRSITNSMPKTIMKKLLANAGSTGRIGLDVAGTSSGGYSAPIFGGISGNNVAFAYLQIPRSPPTGGGASVGFAYNYEIHFRRVMGELLTAWRERKLSNFDYLMAINTLAGRSFNDLTQYPVFPWVLSNYSSSSLDLNCPSNYRDFVRPMGAMTSDRLREFRMRYSTFDDDEIPKFLYGSHFSTAVGTVIHYLLRLHPFTKLHVTYQSGHYDVADRLFSSINDAWTMNTTSLSEVKELTPEWYSSHHFLVNYSRYRFGLAQNGEPIDHVRLPPWAKGSPERFIRTMRNALESDWVSSQIHSWIDLVFGYQQRGPAAVAADNVYYYLTYAGGVDVEAIEDPALRRATQSQITHYGQTPLQVLKLPHTPRGPFPTVPTVYIPPSPTSIMTTLLNDIVTAITTKPVEINTVDASEKNKPKKLAGVGALVDVAKLVAANVKSVGTTVASLGTTNGVINNNGRNNGALTPGLARPLSKELRRFADILGGDPKQGTDEDEEEEEDEFDTDVQPNGSSNFFGIDSPLEVRDTFAFSLVLNRAFSHICTVSAAGCSFWRPDTPSPLPVTIDKVFGPNAFSSAATILSDVMHPHNNRSGRVSPTAMDRPPCIHFSLGDISIAGSAPPSAVVSVRIPLNEVKNVVNLDGANGIPWSNDSNVVSKVSTNSKPFALPIRYQQVLELTGATGSVMIGRDGYLNSNESLESSEATTLRTASSSVFHVWWPIAPEGYVALGCVITAAQVIRTENTAVSSTQSSLDNTNRPSVLMYSTEIRPVPPAADAVLCVHVSRVRTATIQSFVPMPWFSINRDGITNDRCTENSSWFIVDDGHLSPIPEPLKPVNNHEENSNGNSSNTGADESGADEQLDEALSSAAAHSIGSLLSNETMTSAKIADVRASRSKGFALYGINNRASTFVLPIPYSVQLIENTDTFGTVSKHYNLQPTKITPVPEPSDATYHTAYLFAAAVAYEFRSSMLENIEKDPQPFADQHWTADAASMGVAPTTVISRLTPWGTVLYDSHSRMWDFQSLHSLSSPTRLRHRASTTGDITNTIYNPSTVPSPSRLSTGGSTGTDTIVHADQILHGYNFNDYSNQEIPLKPSVMCVRVLNPFTFSSIINNLSLNSSPQPNTALTVPTVNTVLAIDSCGFVDRFQVLSQPVHPMEAVLEHVENAAFAYANVNALPIYNSSAAANNSSFGVHKMSQRLLPHTRIRIVRNGCDIRSTFPCSASGLPQIHLRSMRHRIPLIRTDSSSSSLSLTRLNTASNVANNNDLDDPFGDTGMMENLPTFIPSILGKTVNRTITDHSLGIESGNSVIVPVCITTTPIASADIFCGAYVVTGSGRGEGISGQAIDARERTVTGSSGTINTSSATTLPLVPFAPKRSSATNAATIGRNVLSSVAGATESPPDTMPLVGTGNITLGGTVACWTTRPITSTVISMDGDLLMVGYDDGMVGLWRVEGIDVLSSLISTPTMHSRPDILLRGATAGPVTALGVCRDADMTIVGYTGYVWIYELSRARPLHQLVLHPVSIATDLARHGHSYVSNAVCTGAAITADGNFVVCSTSYIMVPAHGVVDNDKNKILYHAGPVFTEIILYGAATTTNLDTLPIATLTIPAKVTCCQRVRGGGTGDYEGPGALIAIGRNDGVLSLYDGRNLRELVTWVSPQRNPVYSVDISPCTGYLVAGCANGMVATFALPAFAVTVPVSVPTLEAENVNVSATSSFTNTVSDYNHGTSSVSSSSTATVAVNQAVDVAKNAAKSAKAMFGSIFSKKG